MASIKENNLELNYGWPYGESRWNSGMDENIVKLGFESRKRINGILSSPPSSPSNGDAYIVGTAPTGLFSGKFANIAIYDRGSWVFITPKSQEVVFNTSDGCDYIYNNGWSLKLEAEVSPYIKIKDFTFSTGYTITDQKQCLLNITDNHYYQWNGTFPKVVAPGATPASSGGIGAGAWIDRTDTTLRQELSGVGAVLNTLADLKTFDVMESKTYETRGRYSAFDGGGARYTCVSSAAVDGFSSHQANNGLFLVFNSPAKGHHSLHWGVKPNDIGNDYTSNIKSYLTWCRERGYVACIIPGDYTLTETITWYQREMSVFADGVKFRFSDTFLGQHALVYGNQTDPEAANPETGKYGLEEQHKFFGATFIGPAASFGKDGLYIHCSDASAGAFTSFDKCTVIGFRRQFVLGDHAPFTWMNEIACKSLGGSNYQTEEAIYVESSLNSGEQMVWKNCHFGNVGVIVHNTVGYSGGLTFIGGGFDYFKRLLWLEQPIRIRMLTPHIESHTYTSPWIYASGVGCDVYIDKPEMWMIDAITGYLVETNGDSHVKIDDPFFQMTGGYASGIRHLHNPLSTGTCTFNDWDSYKGFLTRPTSRNNSVIPYKQNQSNFGLLFDALSGDGSTVAVNTGEIYNNENPTAITTTTAGQQINRTITIPINKSKYRRLAVQIALKLVGFVSTIAAVDCKILDYKGNVMYAFPGLSPSTDGNFNILEWLPTDTIRAGAYSVAINIYAQPHSATDAASRRINIGELTIDMG